MTESIDKTLRNLIIPIVPVNQSEAATEVYPYAVFEQTITYRRTKDGVAGITAETDIHVYDRRLPVAEAKAQAIMAKLESDMRNDQYVATLRTVNRDCVAEIWDIQLNYTIKQLK